MTKHVNHQYSVPTIYQRVSYTSIFESSFEFLKFNNQATACNYSAPYGHK